MRIGILIDRLNVGGVEKIALEQVRALRAEGHDASLVVLRRKAVIENAFPELTKGIPIIYLDDRLPAVARVSFSMPLFQFFSFFHLTYPVFIPLVVKEREFDYIIAHGTYTAMTAASLARKRGIPFSTFIWDPASYILERVYKSRWPAIIYQPLHYLAHRLDRRLVRATDSVLVGGSAHNDFILKLTPGKHIHTIYPSVHPATTQQPKSDYILVITAWKEGKNPEYLIELATLLPNLQIKMAGKWVNPEYQKYFESLLREKGLAAQIEVIGSVSESELTTLYAEALVLLQTNDDRGFGMPALEAAAQGTSFIIPKGQGVCKLFTNGEDGFYTNEKDTQTIVKHLKSLIKDRAMAVKMGKSALTKVRQGHSWSKHAHRLITVIQEELDESKN